MARRDTPARSRANDPTALTAVQTQGRARGARLLARPQVLRVMRARRARPRARTRRGRPEPVEQRTGSLQAGAVNELADHDQLRGPEAAIPERPGPGRVVLAARGPFRVVGPEALPAGGAEASGYTIAIAGWSRGRSSNLAGRISCSQQSIGWWPPCETYSGCEASHFKSSGSSHGAIRPSAASRSGSVAWDGWARLER
jgi:hypothetical protein